MPKSEEVIKKKRPTGTSTGAIFVAWETLTHAENPNNY
jgi:hypothetical protein